MGIVAFYLLTTLIPEPELPDEVLRKQKEKVKPADGKKSEEQSLWTAGILTAVCISAHNVPEGIAVYIACLRGVGLGLPLALAIAAHNIPEGMAVASPILGATGSKWLALKYTLLSGLCEPAGALLVGYMFTGLLSEYVIHCMLAAVAGVMVLICLKELIPKCLEVFCHLTLLFSIDTDIAWILASFSVSFLLMCCCSPACFRGEGNVLARGRHGFHGCVCVASSLSPRFPPTRAQLSPWPLTLSIEQLTCSSTCFLSVCLCVFVRGLNAPKVNACVHYSITIKTVRRKRAVHIRL